MGLGIVNDNGGRLAIVTPLKIIENPYIAMTPKIHVDTPKFTRGTPNAIWVVHLPSPEVRQNVYFLYINLIGRIESAKAPPLLALSLIALSPLPFNFHQQKARA